jgi:hypothetical protein
MILIFGVIFGAICAAIASSKGRTPVGWFFVGFLLGLIGLIIVLVVPNLHEQQARDARIEHENRRLREQLMQERMKSEVFRQHTAARLDAHDKHLGLDTRATPALAAVEEAAPQFGNPEDEFMNKYGLIPQANLARTWYYEQRGEIKGPVSEQSVRDMVDSGAIQLSTLLWREGLKDWVPATQALQLV